MIRSEQIDKLAASLAKAQGSIEDAEKDSTNPHFKSRYSDFASVRAAVRRPLSENGLCYVQLPRTTEKGVEVETVLMHESGQYIGETLAIPAQMTAHGIGSALTYAKRYGLMAVCGIASSEDDDDGNEASRPPRPTVKREPPPKAAPATPFDDIPSSVDLQALIAMGNEAAERGSETLKVWWQNRSKEERSAIGSDRLSAWKSEAAEAERMEEVPA